MDVSNIFYFFCSGEGKGGARCQEGGGELVRAMRAKFTSLGGRFGYFLFFSARGGEGESGATGRGGFSVFVKNPRRGRVFQEGAAGRVSAGNLEEGGAKYFFSGPKCPPSSRIA